MRFEGAERVASLLGMREEGEKNTCLHFFKYLCANEVIPTKRETIYARIGKGSLKDASRNYR